MASDSGAPSGTPHHPATPDSDPDVVSRRRFLSRISLALAGLAAAVVSVPIVAYLLSPLTKGARVTWLDLGPVSQYKVGETVEVGIDDGSSLQWAGQTARTAVWVRRESVADFIAFAVNCTHLGCPVNWRAAASLFFCPCHGGVYYADGTVAAGPPPRPLTRYQTRIRDGHLELLTEPLTSTLSADSRREEPMTW